MALSRDRIIVLGQSPQPHERRAMELVIAELPDQDPYRLGGFVDLVEPAGRRYDLDLFVVGYHALYLVEMKSWQGTVSGDVVDWIVRDGAGRESVKENPLRLLNQKARVLASLLDREWSRRGKGNDNAVRPFVQPLVFLTHEDVKNELQGAARAQVVTRATLVRAITHGEFPGTGDGFRGRAINKPTERRTVEALRAIGLRPSPGALKVGELALGRLIEEGPGYQDHEAKHERMHGLRRRVRTWLVPEQATTERREQLRRGAEHEARHLTALSDHPGILRLVDYLPEGPTGGPCEVFDHAGDALPLDQLLRANPALSFDERLVLVQRVAEAIDYCHRKGVLHRALHPGAVLVRRGPSGDGGGPGRIDPLEVKVYNFQLARADEGSLGTVHLSALTPSDAVLYRAPEVIADPSSASRASDVFSLGAIAYLVLTGRTPGTSLEHRERLLSMGGLSVAAASNELAGDAPQDVGGGAGFGTSDDQRQRLDEIIRNATLPNPLDRVDSALDWINLLLDAATAPRVPEAPVISPLVANPGDLLGDGLEVVGLLGTGSSSRVLRVRKNNVEYALKVPLSPDHDERIAAEARLLEQVGCDYIVRLEGRLRIAGVPALLLTDAGDTVADVLAREGTPSLDFIHKWGDELVRALEKLEDEEVLHKDVKPSNLGVRSRSKKVTRRLVLFDFSLASVDDRHVTIGTPAYRDPYLPKRRRWDAAADRWSAALTLYELLTGGLPRREPSPEHSVGVVKVDAERFDASIRDRLVRFFARALAPEVPARFVSATSMRTEWDACFSTTVVASPPAAIVSPAATAAPVEEGADGAESGSVIPPPSLALDSPVAALGLAPRALSALDRAGILTVRDLVRLPDNEISVLRGVGRATAQEVLKLVRAVRAQISEQAGDVVPSEQLVADYEGPDGSVVFVSAIDREVATALEDAGLDRLARLASSPRRRVEHVLRRRAGDVARLESVLRDLSAKAKASEHAGDAHLDLDGWIQALLPTGAPQQGVPEEERLRRKVGPHRNRAAWLGHTRTLLGLDLVGGERITDVPALAKKLKKTTALLYIALGKARELWQSHPELPLLHRAVETALDGQGGAAPLRRVGEALLIALAPARVGMTAEARTIAQHKAEALARIAAETTGSLHFVRLNDQGWVFESAGLVPLVRTLGDLADALATREPLPSSDEVREALSGQIKKSRLASLPFDRLVALAADASAQAARSARLELYPRGLDAKRALKLSAGALPLHGLSPELVRRTVAARYPEAEALPERSALDDVVASLDLRWDETRQTYVRPNVLPSPSADRTQMRPTRSLTTHTTHRGPRTAETDAAEECDRRVRLALQKRQLLVLEVTAGYDHDAAHQLRHRFEVTPRSLDRELLAEALRRAGEQGMPPTEARQLFYETDRHGPADVDGWDHLKAFMRESARALLPRLLADANGALVLTDPGLLARYQLDEFLERLVEAANRDDGPAVLLILPIVDAAGAQPIDGTIQALPIPATPGQRYRAPLAWIENRHRGAA